MTDKIEEVLRQALHNCDPEDVAEFVACFFDKRDLTLPTEALNNARLEVVRLSRLNQQLSERCAGLHEHIDELQTRMDYEMVDR